MRFRYVNAAICQQIRLKVRKEFNGLALTHKQTETATVPLTNQNKDYRKQVGLQADSLENLCRRDSVSRVTKNNDGRTDGWALSLILTLW